MFFVFVLPIVGLAVGAAIDLLDRQARCTSATAAQANREASIANDRARTAHVRLTALERRFPPALARETEPPAAAAEQPSEPSSGEVTS